MINHRDSGVQGEQRKYCFDGGPRGAWKHLALPQQRRFFDFQNPFVKGLKQPARREMTSIICLLYFGRPMLAGRP